MHKTLVAGTLAVAVAVGGFSLGRLTQPDRAQAAPSSAPATPAGLPSFASLAPRVSPAVVHIKVVTLERADFQHGGPTRTLWWCHRVSGRLFPFRSPTPGRSAVRVRALSCARTD